MQKLIVNFLQEGRRDTAHVYQSTYNRIKNFTGGRPLKINELTLSLVAKSFPKLAVVLPTSVEYHFHLHENVSCRIFSCRRRKAHNGISPPVPLCLHRNTRNGKTSCRRSGTAVFLQPINTSKYKNGKSTKALSVAFYATRNPICRYRIPETMRFERQHPYLPTPKNRVLSPNMVETSIISINTLYGKYDETSICKSCRNLL